MKIDVFSATGTKTKSMDLPASLFESEANWGLMHQAVIMQQANRRQSAAHVQTRGEIQGSTRKLYAQKHTGQARRGSVRSPLLRGGGKAFGPRNVINYVQDMPQKMRHAALRSSLSAVAAKGSILAIESYPDTVSTKDLAALIKKLPVQYGRKILLVSPSAHKSLQLSARNVPSLKTVRAAYLNAEDVLGSMYIIFLVDAIEEADKIFGKKDKAAKTSKKHLKDMSPKSPKAHKKVAKKTAKKEAKKAAPKAASKAKKASSKKSSK